MPYERRRSPPHRRGHADLSHPAPVECANSSFLSGYIESLFLAWLISLLAMRARSRDRALFLLGDCGAAGTPRRGPVLLKLTPAGQGAAIYGISRRYRGVREQVFLLVGPLVRMKRRCPVERNSTGRTVQFIGQFHTEFFSGLVGSKLSQPSISTQDAAILLPDVGRGPPRRSIGRRTRLLSAITRSGQRTGD